MFAIPRRDFYTSAQKYEMWKNLIAAFELHKPSKKTETSSDDDCDIVEKETTNPDAPKVETKINTGSKSVQPRRISRPKVQGKSELTNENTAKTFRTRRFTNLVVKGLEKEVEMKKEVNTSKGSEVSGSTSGGREKIGKRIEARESDEIGGLTRSLVGAEEMEIKSFEAKESESEENSDSNASLISPEKSELKKDIEAEESENDDSNPNLISPEKFGMKEDTSTDASGASGALNPGLKESPKKLTFQTKDSVKGKADSLFKRRVDLMTPQKRSSPKSKSSPLK